MALNDLKLVFRMVKLGKRPLLAFPDGDTELSLAGIACYPAHTWKRRMVKLALGAAMRCGLRSGVTSLTEMPVSGCDGAALADWLGVLRARLGRPGLRPVFVWPADPCRGRIYAHLLDESGDRVAFCKIALDAPNTVRLGNEAHMLGRLHALHPVRSRIPLVLASGELMGNGWLALETVPQDARATCWLGDPPISPQIEEFAGKPRILGESELMPLPWWLAVSRVCDDHPALGAVVRRATARGVEVCRAHGDLNRTNVLRRAGEVWLLDWEQASEDAPMLTDRACVAVDAAWQAARGDQARLLAGFLASFPGHGEEPLRSRLALALAYLAAAEFTPAVAVVRGWLPG